MIAVRLAKRWAGTAGLALVILLILEVLGEWVLANKGIIASPTHVVTGLWDDRSLYGANVPTTVETAAKGWAVGNAAAIVVAGIAQSISRTERPALLLGLTVFSIPGVALAPVLEVTMSGDAPGAVLAGFFVFFPTLILTLLGLRQADPGALLVARAYGAGRWRTLTKVRVRAALPGIFTGLSLTVPAALVGAILGEFIGANSGLGVMLIDAMYGAQVDRVWGVAAVTTTLALVGYYVVRYIGRLLNPWSSPLDASATASALDLTRQDGHGRLGRLVETLVSIGLILLVWWASIPVFGLSTFVVKNPGDVFHYLFTGSAGSTVLSQIGVTLADAGLGFCVGIAVGWILGVLFVVSPATGRAVIPLAFIVSSVPAIVFVPIVTLVLGRGPLSAGSIAAIVTFFPVLVNTMFGLRSASGDTLLFFQAHDASLWQTLWRLRLPIGLPAMLAAARISAPLAVLGATLAEWLATGRGLGYLIVTAFVNSNYTQMWAAAIVLTLLSIVFYWVLSGVERVVLRRLGVAAATSGSGWRNLARRVGSRRPGSSSVTPKLDGTLLEVS
jgi:sulfonate transport system permease protein